MIGIVPNRSAARIWHLLTAIIALLSIGAQLLLVIGNTNIGFGESAAPLGQRLFEFFSYFTIQSNLLIAIAAILLTVKPDRDGAVFRVLRIAGLFGITVTLVVYQLLLSHLANFTGVAAASNIGLHYVVPALAILGWLLFGPRRLVTWRALFLAMLWPLAFVLLTIVQGMVTGFYPYPFVNVEVLGFARAALNGLGIMLLLLAVGACYQVLDTWLSRSRAKSL